METEHGKALGSIRLAILVAIMAIIIFFIFPQHTELVGIPIILFLLATFGKEFLKKLHVQK